MFFMAKKLFGLFYLSVALLGCTLFSACLDIPNEPETQNIIQSVSIYVNQYGSKDSVLLKINSNDSSALSADVHPNVYKNDVNYYWINGEDILDSGRVYPISTDISKAGALADLFIPNKLIVKDHQGNLIEKIFKVTVNAPPTLTSKTIPAQGDTLFGNIHTSFHFQWESYDPDTKQKLTHILEIDDKQIPVGDLTDVMQSGFKEGRHHFRVIVSDPLGDKDSISTRDFFVIDTTKRAP